MNTEPSGGWVFAIIFVAAFLIALYFLLRTYFGTKKTLVKKKKGSEDSTEGQDTNTPTSPILDNVLPEKPVKKAPEAPRGPGPIAKAIALAIVLVAITGCVAFVITLVGLEGKENVKHHVEVMTAGSHSVPVGARKQYDTDDTHYCKSGHGDATLYPANDTTWQEFVMPPNAKFCYDPGQGESHQTFECRTTDSDFASCVQGGHAVVVYRFRTDKPMYVWADLLRAK